MIKEKNEKKVDFGNISVLLNWFSLNKNWASMFKRKNMISPRTPELTYNKYIKFAKNEKYIQAANYFYITCFPDIAEPLIRMFPNPFDLVKQEIEGKKIMAKDEYKRSMKN